MKDLSPNYLPKEIKLTNESETISSDKTIIRKALAIIMSTVTNDSNQVNGLVLYVLASIIFAFEININYIVIFQSAILFLFVPRKVFLHIISNKPSKIFSFLVHGKKNSLSFYID